jgi:hypothetical protein
MTMRDVNAADVVASPKDRPIKFRTNQPDPS